MYSSGTLTGRFASRLPARVLGEQRLARMAARGEQRAFEALFERYHRELYRYCRAVVGEPDEAHDALQNTMAAALRHLPQLERRSSLRGWLYRVAHNESVSILRRRPQPLDPDGMTEATVPGADASFEERERLRQLVADLAALPHRQRGALVMRELSGLSYSQIAAAIETSEAGARQLVYEARESLRALELGRNLECEAARRVISERDGRMLRGRRVRAHLGACDSCQDFASAIRRRRTDLAAIFPPVVPAAASGLLASLLGKAGHGGATAGGASGTAGGGATIGAGGGAVLGGAGLKAASIASVVAIGTGAAGISEGIDAPFSGGGAETAAGATSSVAGTPAVTASEMLRGDAAGPPARRAHERSRAGSPPGRGREDDGSRLDRPTQTPAAASAAAEGAPSTGPAHAQGSPPEHAGGQAAPEPSAGSAGRIASSQSPATSPPPHSSSGSKSNGAPGGGRPEATFTIPRIPPDNPAAGASTRGVPHDNELEGGTS
jgi:RNA polymerase sigma factor (sigma-70 family)